MKKYIALFMVVCLVSFCPCAWADYWNEGHSGTEADPYVIDTNADLSAMRDRVNAGTESGDMYYRLTQNLNISSITDWESIGTDDNPFTGHFDGNGKSIHVNIDREGSNIAALFGTIATPGGYAVQGLTVSGSLNGKYAAGVADTLNSLASVKDCTFTGTIESRYYLWYSDIRTYAGGIVRNMSNGLISNCNFNGAIKSGISGNSDQAGYAGGIVADMTGGTVENCTVTAASDGIYAYSRNYASGIQPAYAGGIVAYANIANFEAIKGCTFSGTVTGTQYAGGIVGYIEGGNLQSNNITANSNAISIITGRYASGGIAGRIGVSTLLESCDVSSLVTVAGENTAEGIGGIVGLMNASTVRNNQSYATISGDIVNMGGVVGKLDAASYTISSNLYSTAEHGIGNNAQGVPSEEGCIKFGPSIAITTASLPDGVAGSAYTAVLATDSASAVVWTLTNSTSLPEGLTLDRTAGTISGTPSTAGDYTFTVKASPETGAPATKGFTLRIQAQGTSSITITTTSLPSGTVNTSYNAVLSASASNVTWSVSAGSLPQGLSLNSSTGAITGTPTAAGTSSFTIRAVSGSNSAEKALSITVNAGTSTITITTTALPEGIAGMSYSAVLLSNPSGASWTLSGNLPAGLAMDSSGRISGTPTNSGNFSFTATAVYGSARASRTLSVKISPLEITTSALPGGTVSESYSQTLSSNGTGLSWTVSGGNLPPGLTLNASSGLLSGTLTEAGEYTFTVYAHNSYAGASKQFTVTVYGSSSGTGSGGGGGCDSLPAFALILAAIIPFRKSRR
ncbi:MAG: putative Ig domain-containing protein [Synergistaceae bacterium]|nr:putative Ig domain-containing protein [Synergistaceae bacterium]